MLVLLFLGCLAAAQEPSPLPDRYWYCTVVATRGSMQSMPRVTSTCPGLDPGKTKGYPLDAINALGAMGWRLSTVEPMIVTQNEASQTYWLEHVGPTSL